MISIYSLEAEFHFNRDLQCITKFFSKFGVKMDNLPKFTEIKCSERLDLVTRASGCDRSNYLLAETKEMFSNHQQSAGESANKCSREDMERLVHLFDDCSLENGEIDNLEEMT